MSIHLYYCKIAIRVLLASQGMLSANQNMALTVIKNYKVLAVINASTQSNLQHAIVKTAMVFRDADKS